MALPSGILRYKKLWLTVGSVLVVGGVVFAAYQASQTNPSNTTSDTAGGCSYNGYQAIPVASDYQIRAGFSPYYKLSWFESDAKFRSAFRENPNQALKSIKGLHCLNGLDLYPWDVDSSVTLDLSPLAELTNLTTLGIYSAYGVEDPATGQIEEPNQAVISDLQPLSKLTNLEYLHLGNFVGEDISGLAPLTKLENLMIVGPFYKKEDGEYGFSKISDLSPLSNLTKLRNLNIVSDQITDLTALGNLNLLEQLGIRCPCSNLIDISPLGKLTNLLALSLIYATNVQNIEPLNNLVNLNCLNLYGTAGLTEIAEGGKNIPPEIINLKKSLPKTDINYLGLGSGNCSYYGVDLKSVRDKRIRTGECQPNDGNCLYS